MSTWLDNLIVVDEGLGEKVAIANGADEAAGFRGSDVVDLHDHGLLLSIATDEPRDASKGERIGGAHRICFEPFKREFIF